MFRGDDCRTESVFGICVCGGNNSNCLKVASENHFQLTLKFPSCKISYSGFFILEEILWRHVGNITQISLATLPTSSICLFALESVTWTILTMKEKKC